MNANSGTVTPTEKNIIQGENVGELPIPTWDEWHVFNGWYTSLVGGEEVTSSYVPSSDVEIFARWTEIPSYTISFETNGGSSVQEVRIQQGSSIGTLPTTSKCGSSFEGWYTGISDGIKVEDGFTPTESIPLYARWNTSIKSMILNPFEIILSSPGEQQNINIMNIDEIDENYSFSSENTLIATVDSTGKVSAISEGETNILISGEDSNEVIKVPIKIHYSRYTITFEENNGSSVEDKTVYNSVNIGQLPTTYLDHYNFNGWYTNLTDGIQVDENYIINNNLTLYARFDAAIEHTITFDVNGGVLDETTKNVTEDMAIGDLPVPTKSGYYFTGWKDENDECFYQSNDLLTKDVTLKAQWDTVDYVARINSNFYSSIQNAIDAANSDDEIVLLKNTNENFNVNKKIIFNLDSHKLTGKITNNGDLKIVAGTIETSVFSGGVIQNDGRLTIGNTNPKLNEDVIIRNTNSGGQYAYPSGIKMSNDSFLSFNGGEIHSNYNAIKTESNATVIINGGYIESTNHNGIDVSNSDIIFNNGTIISAGIGIINRSSTKTVIMNGGTINNNNYFTEGTGISCTNFIMNGGTILLNNNSSNAYLNGISASNFTMNGGSIIVSGKYTRNLYCFGGSSMIMNNGSISVSGNNKNNYVISVQDSFVMNGGSINVSGSRPTGIYSYTDSIVTINGGSISVTATDYSYAIDNHSVLNLTGGNIYSSGATSYGIYGNGIVNMTDGFIYSKGTDNYYGINSSATTNYPNGKTLSHVHTSNGFEKYYLTGHYQNGTCSN